MDLLNKADHALVDVLHPSPNFGERRALPPPRHAPDQTDRLARRPDMLIMHYTGMEHCAGAIDWLSRPQSGVSCHYVVDVDGTITQMVAEANRAWHAGAGSWGADTDINSASIGIEIHNLGHELGYPDFPPTQMAALTALSKDIIARWQIPAARVLGHSDIAPMRKGDPGEKFDWCALAQDGIGYWHTPVTVDDEDIGIGLTARQLAQLTAHAALAEQDVEQAGEQAGEAGKTNKTDKRGHNRIEDETEKTKPGNGQRAAQLIAQARQDLARFGYGIAPVGGYDLALHKTVLAFQRHYRPGRCDGRLDRSTLASLHNLLAGVTKDLHAVQAKS